MARIAILAAAVVAGIVVGYLTSNPMLGFAVFSGISSIGMALLPQHQNVQPPLNDLQTMSSAPGTPIPHGYGGYRVAGQVIWAQQIQVHKNKQSSGGKGGGQSTTVYTYTIDAAISFGYGPGEVVRIWADAKLVYDKSGKGPIAVGTGLSNSKGVAYTSPFEPTIYTGTNTQLPDPTIQSVQGASDTPAFRDQIYIVLNNFPLADFGNRLPSFRAEITASTQLDYISDFFPGSPLEDLYWMGVRNPKGCFVDPVNRYAYTLTDGGTVAQKIDLDVSTAIPAIPYSPNTAYNQGNQVLDSNGNVQLCTRSYTSGGPGHTPAWQTGVGVYTQVGGLNTWQCIGPGPDVVPLVGQAQLKWNNLNTGSPYSTVYPESCGGIDTGGNLWIQASVSGNAHGVFALLRFNTKTWKNDLCVNINYDPYGAPGPYYFTDMIFLKSGNSGTNYAFLVGGYGYYLGVLNCDNGTLTLVGYTAGVSQLNAGGGTSTEGAQGAFNTPCCIDPNTGLVYIPMTHYNPSNPTWQYEGAFIVVNPNGGEVVSTVNYGNYLLWGGQAYEQPAGLMWNVNDSTLIGIGLSGTVFKLNPKTGKLLASRQNATISSTTGCKTQPKSYNGLVPNDNILKFISHAADISNYYHFDYINATDMSVVQSVSLGNWVPAYGYYPDQMAYDPLTNSMLTHFTYPIGFGTYRIFFDRAQVAETPLSDVITDQWTRAGGDPALLDVSAVTSQMVTGYCITSINTPKANIGPLCQAFFFDLVESDNLLKAVPRGQSVSTTIPEYDMGLLADNYEAIPNVVQEHDMPLTMMVNYYDKNLDYQQGKQMYKRNKRVKKTRNETAISLPITLTPDVAASIAARSLSLAWQERNGWQFKLWRSSYLVIDPTDVVQFGYNGNQHQGRIVKHSAGQNKVLEITALNEDPRTYSKVLAGNTDTGFGSTGISAVASTNLFLMDIPLISDTDQFGPSTTGFYWGAAPASGSSTWPGATLYYSTDGSTFNSMDALFVQALYGSLTDTLGAPKNWFTWDYDNSINVVMATGETLASDTKANVLNGSNWAWIGGEIIGYTNAVLQGDGSYTLSGLLRGLRGTEGWCNGHIANETFVKLDVGNTTKHEQENTSLVGVAQYFRGVTAGNPVTGTASQQLTLAGNDLKPYAVAQLTGYVDGSNNIVMTWTRRTRLGGSWPGGSDTVPLSEQAESYDVVIYDSTGTTVKRTVTNLNTPTYTYTSAQQVTDFGSNQSSVYVVVYQNSAYIGHGFPATNPALGAGLSVSGGSDATSILGVPIVGTPVDGDILQFNALNNEWDIVGPMLKRQTVTFTTSSIADGSVANVFANLGCRSFILLEVAVNKAARVELYETAAFRTADAGRGYGTFPASGSQNGIVGDFGLHQGGPETWVCSPPLIGTNMDSPVSQGVYAAITNNSGSTGTVTVTLTIIPIEH
jgi:hypothetical protein